MTIPAIRGECYVQHHKKMKFVNAFLLCLSVMYLLDCLFLIMMIPTIMMMTTQNITRTQTMTTTTGTSHGGGVGVEPVYKETCLWKEGRGKEAPGIYCLCMCQVPMVTCKLLWCTKIMTNLVHWLKHHSARLCSL